MGCPMGYGAGGGDGGSTDWASLQEHLPVPSCEQERALLHKCARPRPRPRVRAPPVPRILRSSVAHGNSLHSTRQWVTSTAHECVNLRLLFVLALACDI